MSAKGCRNFEELLALSIHGEALDPARREALERHLSVCRSCGSVCESVKAVDGVLRELPDDSPEPSPWLHGRIMANLPDAAPSRAARFADWWRTAWALSATAATAVLAVLLYRAEHVPQAVAPAPAEERVASAAPSSPAAPPAAPSPKNGASAAPSGIAPPAAPKAAPVVVASVGPPAPEIRIVREIKVFLHSPSARRVAVTGDFNGWDPAGVEMKPSTRTGFWEAELRLPPGAYAYNFIVDGDILVPDPESPAQVPDGFGGTNSILLVGEGGKS